MTKFFICSEPDGGPAPFFAVPERMPGQEPKLLAGSPHFLIGIFEINADTKKGFPLESGFESMRGIIFFSLLVSTMLRAEFGMQFNCTDKDGEARVEITHEGGSLELVDLRFDTRGDFVPEVVACERWVEALRTTPRFIDPTIPFYIRELWTEERRRQPLGRIRGETRRALYRFCSQSPYCRVAFPYWLLDPFHSSPLAVKIEPMGEAGKSCFELSSQGMTTRNLSREELDGRRWPPLKDPKLWNTQTSSFTDELASFRWSENNPVVVSTFTLSTSEMVALKKRIGRKAKLFLLFDLHAAIRSDELEQTLALADSRVQLIPVYPYPGNEGLYHIKGAAALEEDRFIFTPSNIKTPVSRSLDLGLTASQPDVKNSFLKILVDKMDATCSNERYLNCFLDAKYGLNSRESSAIKNALKNTCSLYLSNEKFSEIRRADSPTYFLQPSKVRMEGIIGRLSQESRRSVFAATDKFSSSVLLRTLEKLRARGIETRLLLSDSKKEIDSPLVLKLNKAKANSRKLPIAHTKGILFDGRTLLWGSGNLTISGMNNTNELFALIEEPAVIEGFKRYLNTFSALAEGTLLFPEVKTPIHRDTASDPSHSSKPK